MEKTIAAISTAPGIGAIGILRLSGEKTLAVLIKIFRPLKPLKEIEPRRVYLGDLVQDGKILDRVLVTFFKAPYSYTGEDMAEISCHGGRFNTEKILKALLSHAEVSLAEPGEFTKRAFLNSKLDLVQAEAIEDIIYAESEMALNAAQDLLSGKLSGLIHSFRDSLIHFISELEAEIEFPEEPDVALIRDRERPDKLKKIIASMEALASSYDQGMLVREGFHVAILGAPNTGKSTLLNAILGYERALVSSTPGTTRDYIREKIYVNGLPVSFTDTAGVRETQDEVERAGIDRSLNLLSQADAVIFVVDGSRPLHDDDRLALSRIPETIPRIQIINKCDLKRSLDFNDPVFKGNLPLPVSAFKGEGLEDLMKRIDTLLREKHLPQDSEVVLTHIRHKTLLSNSKNILKEVVNEMEKGMGGELISHEVRRAIEELRGLTGEITTEEILGNIFKNFCIGK